jgi:hypothetical protein
MSEYQDEVVINLLDLQAELRGDEPEQQAEADGQITPEAADDALAAQEDTVAVTERGLTVSLSPADMNGRLAALDDRLAKLESHLAGVMERIERIEPAPELQAADSPDAGARSSFLDLQKMVADRLDSR